MNRSLTDADIIQTELDARGRDAVWSVVASGIDSKNLVPPLLSRVKSRKQTSFARRF
jgi:hypothetical protein